jgi:glycosyltransferase involved in cell wall biosynthesis
MISVCMATYNGEKYIEEQLNSILLQLGLDDEVIISDDNSNDNTINIVREFNDKRIKIFKNKGSGLIQNFENAIKYSSGEYIFLADQDDIWNANKVKICLSDFEKGVDLILSDCSIFDSESKETIYESFFDFNKSKKGIINNIIRNSYIGCCMAFNSKVKNKVIPFPKNIPMHDSWIGIVAEIYFKVNFNKSKLISYRKHSGNASDTGTGKSKYSIMKKVSFRFFLANAIIIKYFKF